MKLLDSSKILPAQMLMLVGLHNLPEGVFKRVVARGKEPKNLDGSETLSKAEAKRLRKQMRNIRNIQNEQKQTS